MTVLAEELGGRNLNPWRRVGEVMPVEGEPCLVATDRTGYSVAFYGGDEGWRTWEGGARLVDDHITHWMSFSAIPEPPEEPEYVSVCERLPQSDQPCMVISMNDGEPGRWARVARYSDGAWVDSETGREISVLRWKAVNR